jgi:hypothetical protein
MSSQTTHQANQIFEERAKAWAVVGIGSLLLA